MSLGTTVDARGLACPLPVINTKKILDQLEDGSVITVVDNPVARDNLLRLAQSAGCTTEVVEDNGEYKVIMIKGQGVADDRIIQRGSRNPSGDMVVMVGCATLGQGDQQLGAVLMRSFMFTLGEGQDKPQCLLFLNTGVQLTCEGSEVLESLQTLAEEGCEILSCGTCLDFLGLNGKLQIGRVSNMYEIVEKIQEAGRLITV